MNRLETPTLPSSFKTTGQPGLDLLDGGFGESFEPDALPEIATFAPVHYEPGYAYPLVVWLHGAGQSEHDLPRVMAHVSTRNYVAVAPACCGEGAPWTGGADAAAETEQRVFEAIEVAAARFSVHSDRVFLAGFGLGGTAALRLALGYPDNFAGAASFDGALPMGDAPLRRINALRELPLMISTGGESQRYSDERFCRDLRLLHTAGCRLHVRHEPGDGDLTTSLLSDFDRWMMEIVCGAESSISR